MAGAAEQQAGVRGCPPADPALAHAPRRLGGTSSNSQALWAFVSSRPNEELDNAFNSEVLLFMILSLKIFTAL